MAVDKESGGIRQKAWLAQTQEGKRDKGMEMVSLRNSF